MWPSYILYANSICILVTFGGKIAAPGPTRIRRSYTKDLVQSFCERCWLEIDIPSAMHHSISILRALETLGLDLRI